MPEFAAAPSAQPSMSETLYAAVRTSAKLFHMTKNGSSMLLPFQVAV